MPATLSLITCTRNPRPDILARVLEGVAALRVPAGIEREYLLVDSASAPRLESLPLVAAFLAQHRWAHVVRLEEPGVALARRAGFRASTGALIVAFDDDNVPAPDYLEVAVATDRAHPEVGVWGAGEIRVEFVDPVPAWVDPPVRANFQERAHPRDEFGRSQGWAPFFPVGSGMVARRAAVERWVRGCDEGRYTLKGRAGASLAAGEDAQIIFSAVAAGELVGVVRALRLEHLIPATRCTMRYLTRLEYHLAATVRVARAECFPADPAPLYRGDLTVIGTARTVLSRLRRYGWREAWMELARQLGERRGAELAALSRRSASPPGPPSTP